MLATLLLAASLSFPPLVARDLTGQERKPEQLRGQPVVFLIGFTFESRKELAEWETLMRGVTKGQLRTIEMPVFSGMAVLARPMIDGAMTRKTPKADHPWIWSTTDRDVLTKGLALTTPEKAGITVLVDGEGMVRWMQQGAPSEAEAEKFKQAWQELAK